MPDPVEIEVPNTDFAVTFVHRRVVPYVAKVGSELIIQVDTPIYATPNAGGPALLTRRHGDVVKVEEYRAGWYCVWRRNNREYWMEA